MLNLHKTIRVLVGIEPIRTLESYNARMKLLMQSFVEHQVPGLQSGGYCSEWAARTILDAMVAKHKILKLEIDPALKISDVPGPDETDIVAAAAKKMGCRTAPGLLQALKLTESIHLLSMKLHLSMGKPVEHKVAQQRHISQAVMTAGRSAAAPYKVHCKYCEDGWLYFNNSRKKGQRRCSGWFTNMVGGLFQGREIPMT
eukprot:Skav217397  [mRNA]  locus=scaffold532:658782:659381:- [translate_table: standard]